MADFSEDELNALFGEAGLAPQLFPKYYSMGPVQFMNAGVPSGAAGATATLTKQLTNFPTVIYGLRISNEYALSATPSVEEIAIYQTLKEWVDGEQTVTINLSQQDITGQEMLQSQLVGRRGSVWAPFPAPYPMAGGNNINVVVRRVTPYPSLVDDAEDLVLPSVRATLLCAEFKATRSSMSTRRRLSHGG